jgi:hypothetical protein
MGVPGRVRFSCLAVAALVSSGLLPGCGASGGGDAGGGGGGGTSSYTVGGTVSGLNGSGLVLQNVGGGDLTVSANGTFTFATPVLAGAAYSVSVKTQPSGPSQTCSVSGGSGTVGSANVTAISITCTTNTYTVSGTVSGLSGAGLVLQYNLGGDLAVSANGAFNFASPVPSGAAYAVTVKTQPSGPTQVCSVSGGSGTMGGAAVTGVTVTCSTSAFTVSGAVTGLNGTGLVLQNNGADDLAIDASGAFVFGSGVADGAGYAVSVARQASSPTQYCGVTNGTGTVAGANVTGVAVTCPVRVGASAVALGQNHVDLTWGSIGIAPVTYDLYRSTVSGSRGTLVTETAGVTTTFRDSGLRPNTAFYYTVVAWSAAGASYASAPVTVTTAATPSFPASGTPPPVTGLMATRAGNVVTLSWDAYAGGGFVEVYRTVDHQFPLGSQYTMTNVGSATFVTTLTDTIAGNGLYSYNVGIYNAALTMAAWAEVSIDVPAGTLPGLERPVFDFWSCGLDSSVLHVFWYAAPGAEAYHVYAAPWVGASAPTVITPSQGGTTAALDASTPTPIYQVSPGFYGLDIPLDLLSLGYNAIAVEAVKGTYRSVGGGGNGFPRRAAAPVGVTNVRTARVNPTTMDLTWDASAGAGSYKIYRLSSLTDVVDSTKLAGTTTTTSYRDTGRTPDTNHYYRVTAIAGGPGGGAESAASDTAIGRTFAAGAPVALPPVLLTLGQAWLGWIGANTHGTTYRIYGGGALLPTAVDPNSLVMQTTVGSPTGLSTWNAYVSAPTAAYILFNVSLGNAPVFGLYWVEEVYPDGTASARSPFSPFIFI